MALRTVKLTINGRLSSVEADDSTPLVYVLRDELGLKGTRLGCGQRPAHRVCYRKIKPLRLRC